MAKATLDPPFDFSIGQVWAGDLEIGAHGFSQLLDSDVGGFRLVGDIEVADNIANGASWRWGWMICHVPRLLTSTFPPQYSPASVLLTPSIPQISAISSHFIAQL
ncbi:hypothetical protein [Sphingobium yanoikuyae]|uniref:hypothetical protein n=1 Tax=Sphingobium yanoikuyae TaxID=13690 RepID=UPI0028AEF12A|nr:hypothetical protein [Sphingobium yanoikuyae]